MRRATGEHGQQLGDALEICAAAWLCSLAPPAAQTPDPQLGCDNFVVIASPVNYLLQHTVNEAKCSLSNGKTQC
jgi:hypothetical protein